MNEYLSFRTYSPQPEVRINGKRIEEIIEALSQQDIQVSYLDGKQISSKLIIEVLSQQDIQVFYLDGRQISSKQTFLTKAAEAMKFPAYFGANWDAFDECITDLTWCPDRKYVVLYECPDIFAQADPTAWQIALQILRSAEEHWRKTNTPLEVFLLN